MPKNKPIDIHGMGPLKIDEKGHLSLDDRPISFDVKPPWWVNLAIFIGGISTAFYAIVTFLTYLKM